MEVEELVVVELPRMMAPEAPLMSGLGLTVLMVDPRRRAGAASTGAGAASARLAKDATRVKRVNWKRILNV